MVLLTGIGLLILACVFPPWKFILDFPGRMHIEKPGPYGLIFAPPDVPVTDTRYHSFNGYETEKWTVRIDSVRLVAGLGAVLGLTALFFGVLAKRAKKNDI